MTDTPPTDIERRDRYAAALYETCNPGFRWADLPEGAVADKDAFRLDASLCMGVADTEQAELRAELKRLAGELTYAEQKRKDNWAEVLRLRDARARLDAVRAVVLADGTEAGFRAALAVHAALHDEPAECTWGESLAAYPKHDRIDIPINAPGGDAEMRMHTDDARVLHDMLGDALGDMPAPAIAGSDVGDLAAIGMGVADAEQADLRTTLHQAGEEWAKEYAENTELRAENEHLRKQVSTLTHAYNKLALNQGEDT